MGGNALKSTYTRRYSNDEFIELYRELKPKLEKAFDTDVDLVISYGSKEDHGDMDILVLNDGQIPKPDGVKKILTDDFGANEIHRNSTIYSFDYKELQIDLLFTPRSNWETSKVFFAYNDLGNLMGKIYHKLGLSYGFEGLRYIYRIGDHRKLGEFVICKDSRKIFEFIGLSYDRFLDGFDTVEEIFEYVISSPYFQPAAFYYENLDARNRKRNKKRANYALFIDYVNKKFSHDDKSFKHKYLYDPDKEKYWQMIHDYFIDEFDFLGTLEKMQEKEQKKILIASKFNGDIVMKKYPDLQGKDLGIFIKSFKLYFEGKSGLAFDDFIIRYDNDEIDVLIEVFYDNYHETK